MRMVTGGRPKVYGLSDVGGFERLTGSTHKNAPILAVWMGLANDMGCSELSYVLVAFPWNQSSLVSMVPGVCGVGSSRQDTLVWPKPQRVNVFGAWFLVRDFRIGSMCVGRCMLVACWDYQLCAVGHIEHYRMQSLTMQSVKRDVRCGVTGEARCMVRSSAVRFVRDYPTTSQLQEPGSFLIP